MNRYFFAFSIAGIVSCFSCNSADEKVSEKNSQVPVLSYSVINSYPHDTSSFTQGLTFYDNNLYEGTGEYEGKSKLLQVDLNTGKHLRKISLGDKFFGEGITILRDTVYQLTWQNKIVYAYSLKNFKKILEFPFITEGWGITHDGTEIIISTGSGNLYFYNPTDFRLLRTLAITENGFPVFNLNELEFIDGFVYANQWQYPYILKIDPKQGIVIAKYDVTDLWKRIQAKDPHADVPNGIAYNDKTKKIYITGKRWPELFEIQLSQ